MRVLYSVCCLICCCLCSGTAYSHISFSPNTIKTKPTARPKLSSVQASESIKLASIYFIYSDSQLKDKKVDKGVGIKSNPTPTQCSNGQVYSNGKCVTPCDMTQYPYVVPFSTKQKISPACAQTEACTSGSTVYYKCTACKPGYDNIGGNKCEIPDCSDYPVGSIDSKKGSGGCTQCQINGKKETRCKYTSCNLAWELSGNNCIPNTCKEYPYTSNSISNCVTKDTCPSGTSTKYKCTKCEEGYSVVDGGCVMTCTYEETTPSAHCASVDQCRRSGKTYYACKQCQSGYSNTTPPANCNSASYCLKDGQKNYSSVCDKCNTGFSSKGNSCVPNDCSAYTSSSSSIPGCASDYVVSCEASSGMRYKCLYCDSKGYETTPSEGICKPKRCSTANTSYSFKGYPDRPLTMTSKSDPKCRDNSSYSECVSGETTYYYCNDCNYYKTDYCVAYSSSVETYTGKCVPCSQITCPAKYGWKTTNVVSNATDYDTCYVGGVWCWVGSDCEAKNKANIRYRPRKCQDGYTLNVNTWTCDKN